MGERINHFSRNINTEEHFWKYKNCKKKQKFILYRELNKNKKDKGKNNKYKLTFQAKIPLYQAVLTEA